MTDEPNASGFPLPQVAEALEPYIRPRQEILDIRRILGLYLATQIDPSGTNLSEAQSLLGLNGSSPERSSIRLDDIAVGKYREYLLALNENSKARSQFDSLRGQYGDTIKVPELSVKSGLRDTESDLDHLRTYLNVQKLRQLRAKLEILTQELHQLTKSHSTVHSLIAELQETQGERIDGKLARARLGGPPIVSDAHENELATLELERAILQAHELLVKEKADLETQKAKSKSFSLKEPSLGAKYKAVSRTRDELIKWIETELPGNAVAGDDSNISARHMEDTSSEMGDALKRDYDEYVEVRKNVVEMLSTLRSARAQQLEEPKAKTEIEEPAVDDLLVAHNVLPPLSSSLIPISSYQRLILQQKAHMTTTLSRHQRMTLQEVERLADESQLLEAYPLLKDQPRFSDLSSALAVTSLEPAFKPSGIDLSSTVGEQCFSRVKAWSFASDAAKTATEASVSKNFKSGMSEIETATSVLEDLQHINESGTASGLHSSDTSRKKTKGSMADTGGAWSRLNHADI
jgi:hypothetical protein